jgi:hypothetical protein
MPIDPPLARCYARRMKWRHAVLAALLAGIVAALACSSGGGSSKSTPSSADATFQAARSDATKTPVSESLRAYAQQLCGPIKTFIKDAGGTLSQLNETPTPNATQSLEEAFGQAFALLGNLKGPIQALQDSLRKMDPPTELRSYHASLIAEFDYALKVVDAIGTGGLAAALALPTQEATPENPAGFEAALLQECGEDLRPFADQLGGLFGGGSQKTPTPPPPGRVGTAVRSANYELLVQSVSDPYASTDPAIQPPAGKRWVLLDVSLTNVSDRDQNYGSFDFKLRDADNFQYDPSFVNQPHEIDFGSLRPGETIRGGLGFELPETATATRLVYEPGFGFEGRIDIDLR